MTGGELVINDPFLSSFPFRSEIAYPQIIEKGSDYQFRSQITGKRSINDTPQYETLSLRRSGQNSAYESVPGLLSEFPLQVLDRNFSVRCFCLY